MPPRKKSKPNPLPRAEAETRAQQQPLSQAGPGFAKTKPKEPAVHQHRAEQAVPVDNGVEPIENAEDGTDTPQSSKSWYGGTWPRGNKATPVTKVAKESISVAGGAAFEVVASARAHTPQFPSTPLKTPAVYLSRNIGSSSRSLPLAATTTKLNISSDAMSPATGTSKGRRPSKDFGGLLQDQETGAERTLDSRREKPEDTPSKGSSPVKNAVEPKSKDRKPDNAQITRDTASWLNWFSRAEQARNDDKAFVGPIVMQEETSDAAKGRPPNTVLNVPKDEPAISTKQRRNSDPSPSSPKSQDGQPSRWLSLWGNATTQTSATSAASATGVATDIAGGLDASRSTNESPNEAKKDPVTTPKPPSQPTDTGKSYGWAFWSRDELTIKDGLTQSGSNTGELVLADSPSQSKPEDAVVDEARGVPNKVGKRQRPQSLEVSDSTKNSRSVDESVKKESLLEAAHVAGKAKPTADPGSKAKRMPENLLLPSFRSTYNTVGRPSLIQQLGRLLQLSQPADTKHVDIVSSPPQIKRALAIGVHGYFPAPLIRSVLGQPTGTSIRFANSAASAIQRWTQNQGYSCEIEKVALEGEGKIADRIDLLWKLMLNWIDKIQRADFVMIACHSQGVPVAMMLVSKLIAFGCVNSAKIGVCAMAGVNLGPFADYKSRWISGSAGELFDFARPDSQVSKDYEAALDVALRFGVKIVYIGSIDDQLVSLESSTFGNVTHPYIYRAVFVDGRVHAPDFLTHLVGFALKLRNLGISDHGLIRELSTPLAGSLYGGEGHSRIYDDEAVYYLAVEFALETSRLGINPLVSKDVLPITTQNPYILPFAMRGVLEEDYVRMELYDEITQLIKQFDDWKPSSKVLKDVKFRLEGVRSKL